MYGKNIHSIYHNDVNFYYVIKISVKFGTYTAQSLLNHKWYL